MKHKLQTVLYIIELVLSSVLIGAVCAMIISLPAEAAAPVKPDGFGEFYVAPTSPECAPLERIPEPADPAYPLTDVEFDLVCRLICLEAGGEDEDVQRAVTGCVFNRCVSGLWGDVSEVVYAADQFEVVPELTNAEPSELTREVVRDVFDNGTDIPARVMFFRKDYYHSSAWAVEEFAIGCVCFSSSKWLEVSK